MSLSISAPRKCASRFEELALDEEDWRGDSAAAADVDGVHGLGSYEGTFAGFEGHLEEGAAAGAALLLDVALQSLGCLDAHGSCRRFARGGLRAAIKALRTPELETADHRRRAEPEAEQQPEKDKAEIAKPRVRRIADRGGGGWSRARQEPDPQAGGVVQFRQQLRVLLDLLRFQAARGRRQIGGDGDDRTVLLVRDGGVELRPQPGPGHDVRALRDRSEEHT